MQGRVISISLHYGNQNTMPTMKSHQALYHRITYSGSDGSSPGIVGPFDAPLYKR